LQDESSNVYRKNLPEYSNVLGNFQDFLVTLDRKDWESQIKIKESQNYFNK